MRLRDVSEKVRDILETSGEGLVEATQGHPMVKGIRDAQTVYRPILSGGKGAGSFPWLCFTFDAEESLIAPFNIYPQRYWAMVRVHKQPSGLPELVVHVTPDLPGVSEKVEPFLYVSFSKSRNVETKIKVEGDDPIRMRFGHTGNLMLPDRTVLSRDFCLPGIEQALGEADESVTSPGIVDDRAAPLYLGDLVFYNGGRTIDRKVLIGFVLNAVGVAAALRYVRDIVAKNLSSDD